MTGVGERFRDGLFICEQIAYKKKSHSTVPEVLDPHDVDVRVDRAIGFKGSLAVVTSILDVL